MFRSSTYNLYLLSLTQYLFSNVSSHYFALLCHFKIHKNTVLTLTQWFYEYLLRCCLIFLFNTRHRSYHWLGNRSQHYVVTLMFEINLIILIIRRSERPAIYFIEGQVVKLQIFIFVLKKRDFTDINLVRVYKIYIFVVRTEFLKSLIRTNMCW